METRLFTCELSKNYAEITFSQPNMFTKQTSHKHCFILPFMHPISIRFEGFGGPDTRYQGSLLFIILPCVVK